MSESARGDVVFVLYKLEVLINSVEWVNWKHVNKNFELIEPDRQVYIIFKTMNR